MTLEDANLHYSLQRLGEGVHAAVAKDGGAAISNAGLVDLGGTTLVVDTFLTPTAAEVLKGDAQRLTGRDPRWVVDTHYHNDHIWGNQAFVPEADLICTVETRALIQTAGKEEYEDYRAITSDRLKTALAGQAAAQTDAQRATFDLWVGYFSGLEHDFPRLRVIMPNLVFQNRMVLYGSKRRAELVSFSGAHTGSDAVVYLPEDGILFMSDLLFVGFHPYLGDGNPDRWLEVLRSILDGTAGTGSASRFVPGHGPTGSRADVQRLIDYIQQCQQIARALASDSRAGAEEIAAAPIPAAYADWTLPRFFYANLNFLVEKYRAASQPTEAMLPRARSNSFRP